MPFKLIGAIILLVIVTIFCGSNLADENRCDVNLIFYTCKNVPAFLTVLISFIAGIIVTVPFTFGKNKLTKEQILKEADKQKAAIAKKTAKNQERAQVAEARLKKKAAHEAMLKRKAERKQSERRAKESSKSDFWAKLFKKKAAKSKAKSVNDVPVINTDSAHESDSESDGNGAN